MTGNTRAPSRITAAILVATLAQPPAVAQSGDFCPIIPQTKTRQPFSPAGRFIILSAAMPESVQYRLRFASSRDLVLVDSASLKSEAARDALRASRAQVVLKTDQAPDTAARLLSRRVTDAETIVAIPTSGRGVANMYGLTGEAQARALRHFQDRVAKPLASLPNTSIVSERTTSGTIAAAIEQKARTTDVDKPLIVVAHNENGILLFPDGSKLEIARIQSLGAPNRRPVLVLSCETVAIEATAGLATTRRLGFDEIALALSVATARLTKTPDAPLGTLIQELNAALNENSAKTGRRIRVALAVVGAGVIVAVALVLQDDDERKTGR